MILKINIKKSEACDFKFGWLIVTGITVGTTYICLIILKFETTSIFYNDYIT